MAINCILAGVGGQGVILASRLIAQAAMNRGLNARTAETIGMAQRGGGVVSHVRVGEEIHSSMVPIGAADLILGFEPGEAVRCLPYLRQGGAVVVNSSAVIPVTASLSGSAYSGAQMIAYLRGLPLKLTVVDGGSLCKALGSAKILNVALLGAACASGALPLSIAEIEKAVRERVAPRFIELNLRALESGARAAVTPSETEKENLHENEAGTV